jgi:hypothetical protein
VLQQQAQTPQQSGQSCYLLAGAGEDVAGSVVCEDLEDLRVLLRGREDEGQRMRERG